MMSSYGNDVHFVKADILSSLDTAILNRNK